MKSRYVKGLLAGPMLLAAQGAWAYAEFQIWVDQHSPRTVNCAMCHTHPDGPEGLKPGQMGALSPGEMERLNRARAAFEPGGDVDNPLLNEFGNFIMEQLGKNKVLELREDPGALADAIGFESDLDGDGIPDAQEYLDGTHPLDPHHGDPWKLFWINLRRYAFHIVMLMVATGAGVYGLNHFIRGFEQQLAHDEDDG